MNKSFFYGRLARFLRAVVRPCLCQWDVSGAHRAEAPAVYVVHHRNLSGPVHNTGPAAGYAAPLGAAPVFEAQRML